MNLTQWSEHQESVEVAVDARGIRIGDLRYPWTQIDAREQRWESRPDGTFGWMVHLEGRAGDIVLAASERNYTRWDQSDRGIEAVPDDVWQVNLVVLQEIRRYLSP